MTQHCRECYSQDREPGESGALGYVCSLVALLMIPTTGCQCFNPEASCGSMEAEVLPLLSCGKGGRINLITDV